MKVSLVKIREKEVSLYTENPDKYFLHIKKTKNGDELGCSKKVFGLG